MAERTPTLNAETPAAETTPANYFFWQDRLNVDGWRWGGWNTSRAPATIKGGSNSPDDAALGYGYFPFRNMAKNYLMEADGTILSDNRVVVPAVYFQVPYHMDVVAKAAVAKTAYDGFRHAYLDLGTSTTLSSAVSAGTSTIGVASSTGFSADDEIHIGAADAGEINEIQSVSGNTLTLKRDHLGYASGTAVARVRELGRVELSTAGDAFGVSMRRSGNDLLFKDNNSASEVSLNAILVACGLR